MTASTFDTLTATRELEAADIKRRQAEAIATQLRTVAIANRGDFAIRDGSAVLRSSFYHALWIQGAVIVGAQIAIAGLIVSLLS